MISNDEYEDVLHSIIVGNGVGSGSTSLTKKLTDCILDEDERARLHLQILANGSCVSPADVIPFESLGPERKSIAMDVVNSWIMDGSRSNLFQEAIISGAFNDSDKFKIAEAAWCREIC